MSKFTKQPSEKFPIIVGFINWLGPEETINTQSVVAINLATGEDVTSELIEDSAIVQGTRVWIRTQDGDDGAEYQITIKIVTSAGNSYENDVFLSVKEIPPEAVLFEKVRTFLRVDPGSEDELLASLVLAAKQYLLNAGVSEPEVDESGVIDDGALSLYELAVVLYVNAIYYGKEAQLEDAMTAVILQIKNYGGES